MPSPAASRGRDRESSARARQDWVVVQAALAGNAKAYEDLLLTYRKAVYYLILKMVRHAHDAQDLTQEVFAKAFRHLARYQPEFAFSTWLFRIATNHSFDFIRRHKLPTVSLQAEGSEGEGDRFVREVPDPGLNPQEAYIRQQRLARVHQLVNQLPPKYQQLVRLRYFQELSYEEMAAALQLPLGTLKVQLFRARQLLVERSKGYPTAL